MKPSGHCQLTIVLLVLQFLFAASALAGSTNVDSDGIAIEGHDPVAYFSDNAALQGNNKFTAEYAGATYKFTSDEHKQAFINAPEKYAPQYGGFCAFAIARGSKASVEPDKFTIVDGKLYLNYNGRVQEDWRKDIPAEIATADKNWPNLK